MKKCLITGGSGLIGRWVINKLLEDGWEVWGVGRQPLLNLTEKYHFISCDLEENSFCERFPLQMDAVIHLAQSEYFRDFPENVESVFNVNAMATLKLLDYAKKSGATHFILASSGGIYGYGDEEFLEDMPITTKSDLGFYLGTKLCSELLAENYTPYLNVVVFRFFFVYGPGQKSHMLIPRLIKSVEEGKPIVLQGENGLSINPIFVADASEAVCRALSLNESQKFNIGGKEVFSLRQIGENIGDIVGKSPIFEIQNISARNIVGDIRKMKKFLCVPSTDFIDGLKNTIEDRIREK